MSVLFAEPDWDREELWRVAFAEEPHAIALSDDHYEALYGERPEPGPQLRVAGAGVGLYVLPRAQREQWLPRLDAWLADVRERPTARAFVLDADGRLLLVRFRNRHGDVWWSTPGGGIDPGETAADAIRRELREEAGLEVDDPGPVVDVRDVTISWDARLVHLREESFLVRVDAHQPAPTIDLAAENVVELAWWTPEELAAPRERLSPADLADRVRRLG